MLIISASRRTDIPAFHSEWFLNRLKEGYVHVRNPGHERTVYRVPLTADAVDMIVFITKNPYPIVDNLNQLKKDYQMSFQITVNPYDKSIEPNVPHWTDIADSFHSVSKILGKDKTIWRYDPVIFNDDMDIEYHKDMIEKMCDCFKNKTERCCFSFFRSYEKTEHLLSAGVLREPTDEEKNNFCEIASKIFKKYGIRLTSCGINVHYNNIESVGCIDSRSMRAWNIPYEMPLSPIRQNCNCVKNVDIGAYDTCFHDCLYCYANSSHKGKRIGRLYDPGNSMLFGSLTKDDNIIDLSKKARITRLSDF